MFDVKYRVRRWVNSLALKLASRQYRSSDQGFTILLLNFVPIYTAVLLVAHTNSPTSRVL